MMDFLSKLLPTLVYPLALACLLILLAIGLYRSARWQRAALILALALLWIGGSRWVSAGLARSLENRHPAPNPIPQAEALVLLGGGTDAPESPRPGVELNSAGDRVIYAAKLYREGKAPYILVSGGLPDWDRRASTPAEDMAALLEWMDVPADAIWLQGSSHNTYEDALYSAQILKERKVTRILLVTSAWHMPRALQTFEAQGFEVIPAPTDYNVTEESWRLLFQGSWQSMALNIFPGAGNLSLTTRMLKEYFGLIVYRLRGWIE